VSSVIGAVWTFLVQHSEDGVDESNDEFHVHHFHSLFVDLSAIFSVMCLIK
jgi:hypothetical protein